LSTLDDNPIPPEALPKVLEEYKRLYRRGFYLTTRQAKWLARLSSTKCEEKAYVGIALVEQLGELIGKPFALKLQTMELAGLQEELASMKWVPHEGFPPNIWRSLQPPIVEEYDKREGTE
jgi:hypothetical protein